MVPFTGAGQSSGGIAPSLSTSCQYSAAARSWTKSVDIVSRRILDSCFFGPWQLTQCDFSRGSTSRLDSGVSPAVFGSAARALEEISRIAAVIRKVVEGMGVDQQLGPGELVSGGSTRIANWAEVIELIHSVECISPRKFPKRSTSHIVSLAASTDSKKEICVNLSKCRSFSGYIIS